MNIIEKIISNHSDKESVKAGDIVDIKIDARVARDFGGANVVKNLVAHNLNIDNPLKTFFTFDCNPTGSDQKYAANQQACRIYAREQEVKVFDINEGIGTHLAIDKGLLWPGSTFVSTDSHANIMGAIGAFGQGMGDQDIAATFAKGSVWFKVPKSAKLIFSGKVPADVTAKDFILNMLKIFGANSLLGYSVEMYGECIDKLTLDERITIASMATEMGAIIFMFTPTPEIIKQFQQKTGKNIEIIIPDTNAEYDFVKEIDVSAFVQKVSKPGHPEDTIPVNEVNNVKIDSAFIGSCTNGRMEDLKVVANILKGRKVAPGVVLKIVPTTNVIWDQCLEEGLIKIFKDAGAIVFNAGCAGCAAGQVGQNGPKEITISTGNRNFPGKQGMGEVWLASPKTVTASALAGYITTEEEIPEKPVLFKAASKKEKEISKKDEDIVIEEKPILVEGKVWYIQQDNIDTDMIFHNRYLTITDINEMGQYTFDNLKGYKDFAKKVKKGDIIITLKNFGAGSSRQQAVDCFKSLGINCIIAKSFGAIYERNAINAGFPILTYETINNIEPKDGDIISINYETGELVNKTNGKTTKIIPFSDVQLVIYKKGGLLA